MRKVLAALLTGAMLLLPTAALAKGKPMSFELTVVSQENGNLVVGVAPIRKVRNPYSTWIAVVCRDGDEVATIQDLGVVWNDDVTFGTAGPFSLDTRFCYAYAWIFPSAGEDQRVSERLILVS